MQLKTLLLASLCFAACNKNNSEKKVTVETDNSKQSPDTRIGHDLMRDTGYHHSDTKTGNPTLAIISADTAWVYDRPDESSGILRCMADDPGNPHHIISVFLLKGEQILLRTISGDWCYIEYNQRCLAGSNRGWVKKETVTDLKK